MADYTLRPIDEMETFYHGLFRRARAEVGAESFGLAVIDMEPSGENHPDHDHAGGQEEVYVVLQGWGTLRVDEDEMRLEPGVIVRVGPNARRRIVAGPEGLRALAIGGTPGHVYEPPKYTELGEADPLG